MILAGLKLGPWQKKPKEAEGQFSTGQDLTQGRVCWVVSRTVAVVTPGPPFSTIGLALFRREQAASQGKSPQPVC